MLRKLLLKLIIPRHPWRKVTFSELSEMYIAGLLKNFAAGLIGVFIPLYLLNNGYPIQMIFVYYSLVYFFLLPIDYLSAKLTARFGPKHVMRVGFFFQFLTAVLLSQIKILPAPILLIPLFHAFSAGLYWTPYHVDLSKIKHNNHSGKELGWLQLMERIGGIIGPLSGGVLASRFGGSALFYAAAAVLAFAVVVLMLSKEPIQTKQKLVFKNLFTMKEWRNSLSYMALVSENSMTVILWPTYLAVVVFPIDPYVKIGLVASISVGVAASVALPLGRVLDKVNGSVMLKLGTTVNGIIHIGRLFATNLGLATAVAASNEPNTLVYRMAYLKGFYDDADNYPGQRIAYIAKSEIIAHFFCLLIWTSIAVVSIYVAEQTVFIIGFIIAALLSLLIQSQKYRALS